jgi:hypothetical protein
VPADVAALLRDIRDRTRLGADGSGTWAGHTGPQGIVREPTAAADRRAEVLPSVPTNLSTGVPAADERTDVPPNNDRADTQANVPPTITAGVLTNSHSDVPENVLPEATPEPSPEKPTEDRLEDQIEDHDVDTAILRPVRDPYEPIERDGDTPEGGR